MLDDSSHNSERRQARDNVVETILRGANLPLLRIPVRRAQSLRPQADLQVMREHLAMTIALVLSCAALLLAAVGLYGAISHAVGQRTREIGVRMALGAGGQRVRRMILGQVGRVVLVGGLIGFAGAYYLGRIAQSLLFEVQGQDPLVMALVAMGLAAVALGAGYMPARRASRVDPMVALRHE